MNIKAKAGEAFTEASPYDWYPETWELYALVLSMERQSYPNAPEKLRDRITLRGN